MTRASGSITKREASRRGGTSPAAHKALPAEQSTAADCLQRPLLRRFRFRQQLSAAFGFHGRKTVSLRGTQGDDLVSVVGCMVMLTLSLLAAPSPSRHSAGENAPHWGAGNRLPTDSIGCLVAFDKAYASAATSRDTTSSSHTVMLKGERDRLSALAAESVRLPPEVL